VDDGECGVGGGVVDAWVGGMLGEFLPSLLICLTSWFCLYHYLRCVYYKMSIPTSGNSRRGGFGAGWVGGWGSMRDDGVVKFELFVMS
jgi:hypothetical protein